MKKVIPIGFLLIGQFAFADNDKFFNYNGSVGSFTKVGFNNVKIDVNKGIYPTDSFSTIVGKLDTTYNFNKFLSNDYISKLEVGLGISAGALTWDSTRNDGYDWSGGYKSGSGLNNNYVGAWNGYFGDRYNAEGYPISKNRNYVIQNAYLALESKYFDFKGGRYESTNDYYSGYTQGFEAAAHFNYGTSRDNEVKFWWFSSFGRAFAYSQWFMDFYAPKYTLKDNGKKVNYGIHSAGVDIVYGEFNKIGEYKSGDEFLVRPFTYFYPGLFTAPGAKLVYEKAFGNGYGIKATLQGYELIIHNSTKITKDNPSASRYNEVVDKYSENLNAILEGYIYNYNLKIGYYENFGSANSNFGTYGNPMGIDYWTTSVYDIGANISDIINRNAKSVYLGGGGEHILKYGKFTWEILARYTNSPRSDENSIALFLNHTFVNNIALGLKLEYLRDTTNAGYNPGASLPGSKALNSKRTDDRSHAFITLDYNF